MKKLIEYVRKNLDVSDAELAFTAEKMEQYRCPLSCANPSLYDRIYELAEEYFADVEPLNFFDECEIEEIFAKL